MKIALAGSWRTVVVVALCACNGQTLHLGSNDAGDYDAACPAASASPPFPEAGPWDSGSSLGPLVGTWQGYAEAFTFHSGSDTIVLVFAKAADGSIQGTVTYGQGTPPPPPTDPNVGYPPGTDWGQNDTTWLIEGFPFAVTHPAFDGSRLQLHTFSHEAWKSWCELQTPTGAGYPCGSYGCLPNWDSMGNPSTQTILTDRSTGATMTVDSGKWVLCNYSPTCDCSSTSCTVDMTTQGDGSFDMQLSGSKLDGPMSGEQGKANVHFTRSP